MAISINEAVVRIRKLGASRVRSVPMSGQSALSGQYQIDIKEGADWETILEGLPKTTAEDIIRQATNRVICG